MADLDERTRTALRPFPPPPPPPAPPAAREDSTNLWKRVKNLVASPGTPGDDAAALALRQELAQGGQWRDRQILWKTLDGASLDGVLLTRCSLKAVGLAQSIAVDAAFTDCQFTDVNFEQARLARVNFTRCRFSNCRFSQAVFEMVCFTDCELRLCAFERITGREMAFYAVDAMLAVSPLAAYDARLQLSALAVAGIGLFWPPFMALSARLRLPRRLRLPVLSVLGILWTSLCAEAAVLPVIVRLFGEWNFNPWINVPWLPLLGFVVTPMALIGQMLLPFPFVSGIGASLLLGAAWFCEGLMRVLAFLDARGLLLSFAVLRPSWAEMLGCFGLLACLALVVAGRQRPLAAMAKVAA